MLEYLNVKNRSAAADLENVCRLAGLAGWLAGWTHWLNILGPGLGPELGPDVGPYLESSSSV
jgi:hypothetical protein